MKEQPREFAEVLYILPGTSDADAGLLPLHLGRNIAKPNYQRGPRQIQCFSLHYVKAGSIRFTCDDLDVVLSKGDLFCLFPNRMYTYYLVPADVPLQMIWIAFNGKQGLHYLEVAGMTVETPYLRRNSDQQLDSLFARMQEAASTQNRKQKIFLIGLLYQLFGELTVEADGSANCLPLKEWIQRAMDFMNAHYSENITIGEIAQQFAINRSHFSKAFTKSTGISPIRYLQNLRLSRGGYLLRNTTLSILKVALISGYPDQYAFTRSFTQHFGMPPGQYRRSQKK